MNTDINTTYENDQKRIKQIISDEINPINHKEIFQYPISLLEKTHETDFQSCYETLSWAVINKLNLSNRIEDYAQTVYIQAIKNKPIYQININRDLLQLEIINATIYAKKYDNPDKKEQISINTISEYNSFINVISQHIINIQDYDDNKINFTYLTNKEKAKYRQKVYYMFTNFILEILTSFFEIEIFPTLQNRDANVTQFTPQEILSITPTIHNLRAIKELAYGIYLTDKRRLIKLTKEHTSIEEIDQAYNEKILYIAQRMNLIKPQILQKCALEYSPNPLYAKKNKITIEDTTFNDQIQQSNNTVLLDIIKTPNKYTETSANTDKYISQLADVSNSITPSPTTTNTKKNIIQLQNIATTIDTPTILTTYTTDNNNEPIEINVTAERPEETPINTTIQIINTSSQQHNNTLTTHITSKQLDLTKLKLRNKTETTNILNNKNRILNTVTKKQKKTKHSNKLKYKKSSKNKAQLLILKKKPMLQQPKLLKYAIIQFSKNIIKNAKETEIRHLKKLKNKLQNLINKLEQIQNTELNNQIKNSIANTLQVSANSESHDNIIYDPTSLEYNNCIKAIDLTDNNNELTDMINLIMKAIKDSKELQTNGQDVHYWHFKESSIILGTSAVPDDETNNNNTIQQLSNPIENWIKHATNNGTYFYSVKNKFNSDSNQTKRWQAPITTQSLEHLHNTDNNYRITLILKALLVVFGEKYMINFLKIIKSDKGCPRQDMHTDYIESAKTTNAENYINYTLNFDPANNMSYSFFYDIYDGSPFYFKIGDMIKRLFLTKRDFLLFPAIVYHAGSDYSKEHFRIFGYINNLNWPANPNYILYKSRK